MSNEIVDQDFISKELTKYSLSDAKIAELSAKYMPLKVKDPNDRMNYDICKIAYRDVQTIRVGIEKKRVELKAKSLDFGRKVDAEAKRLSQKIQEIEDHLSAQRKVVEDEIARVKKEKEDAIKAEEMRKKQEEEERLNRIREEQEAKQRELDAREEKMRAEEEEKRLKAEEEKRERERQQEAIKLEHERIEIEKEKIEIAKSALAEKEKQEKIVALYRERAKLAMSYVDFWKEDYEFGTITQKEFDSILKELKAEKKKYDENKAKEELIFAKKQKLYDERLALIRPYKDFYIDSEGFEYLTSRTDLEFEEFMTNLKKAEHLHKDRLLKDKIKEEARLEALKPDIQKLKELGDLLLNLKYPDVSTKEAKFLINTTKTILTSAAQTLIKPNFK